MTSPDPAKPCPRGTRDKPRRALTPGPRKAARLGLCAWGAWFLLLFLSPALQDHPGVLSRLAAFVPVLLCLAGLFVAAEACLKRPDPWLYPAAFLSLFFLIFWMGFDYVPSLFMVDAPRDEAFFPVLISCTLLPASVALAGLAFAAFLIAKRRAFLPLVLGVPLHVLSILLAAG